jgi:putative hemolysin
MQNLLSAMEYINIRKILKEGRSKKLGNLPDFAYTILEKIIKLKEINRLLKENENSSGIDFLNNMIDYLNLKVEVTGLENLPENGKCFFVGNHAFGIIDGLIITKTIYEKYGQLKFIGNEAFLLIPNLRHYVAAVNVYDKSPKEYLMALEQVFESDTPVTHFPNGSVSRIHKMKVMDNNWHKSFIAKSVSCKRDVVPIRFYGRNSNLFYTIYILRRLFFIHSEIETALLPREFFNKKNKTVRVRIGKPIPYERFNNTYSHCEWAQKVKEEVYNL